jgi:hypothetical protein
MHTSASKLDALGFLQAIYRSEGVPLNTRVRAAMAALPFEKPKLSALALVNRDDLADRLMRAIEASAKVGGAQQMKVIEPPKAGASPDDEVPDHSVVIPPLSRSGFSKRPF